MIITGDVLDGLAQLPERSAHCCVTSPPYWGLRDYGVEGQIGLEATPAEYVEKIVGVFREVRRVLRKDGTVWLNLGDSYHGSWGNSGSRPELDGKTQNQRSKEVDYLPRGGWDSRRDRPPSSRAIPGLKPKDLVGIPWRVAFALQADGWWLRSDIVWAKPNPMPESVRDRPTKAHEYMFLLAKSERYYYDAEAIKEQGQDRGPCEPSATWREPERDNNRTGGNGTGLGSFATRNRRSVWTVASQPFNDWHENTTHFATFPPDLIKPCILAGCPVGGTVLDPFAGSGTTGAVAAELGRNYILIELNPAYVKLIGQRLNKITPGLPL